MRILEFEVQKQRLKKRPLCDFSGLVAGSVGYLKALFYFSKEEWSSCSKKVARFWINGEEHATMLGDDNSCEIPHEVLTGDQFEVSVLGVAPGYKIETNKIRIRQEVC